MGNDCRCRGHIVTPDQGCFFSQVCDEEMLGWLGLVIDSHMFQVLYLIIACPKGMPPKAARPKDGLFRLHASWIYLSYAGFHCLAAILCH